MEPLLTGWRRRVIIVWSFVSGFVHVAWELLWCFLAPTLASAGTKHGALRLWTAYGHADARYLHMDPFILALEGCTGVIASTLNFWVAWHLWRRRGERGALVALFVVSVMESYGCILYFGSELFNHFANVDTASAARTWGLFFGLNALWLVFPGWCLYELAVHFAGAKKSSARDRAVAIPGTPLRAQ